MVGLCRDLHKIRRRLVNRNPLRTAEYIINILLQFLRMCLLPRGQGCQLCSGSVFELPYRDRHCLGLIVTDLHQKAPEAPEEA